MVNIFSCLELISRRHPSQLGWVHLSVKEMITRNYGEDKWSLMVKLSGMEEGSECDTNSYYADDETFRLITAVSSVLRLTIDDVWEEYGGFILKYMDETGFDHLFRAMSNNLQGFCDNLDALLYFVDHVIYKGKLKSPSFRCERNSQGDLLLHYYAKINGLYPVLKGFIRDVSEKIFGAEVRIRIIEKKMEIILDEEGAEAGAEEHVILEIVSMTTDVETGDNREKGLALVADNQCLQLNLRDFAYAFPYHVCFDKTMTVKHFGNYISMAFPDLTPGTTHITDFFEIVHPQVPVIYENILHFANAIFVFRLKNYIEQESDGIYEPILLRGQMMVLDNLNMIYLASPYVTSVEDMVNKRLYLGDIPVHDATRDMLLINQSRSGLAQLNTELEQKTIELQETHEELNAEKEKTDALLNEMMPPSVTAQLRAGGVVNAAEYSDVSILFTDIVGFTNICSILQPMQIVDMLNDLYSRFDRLTVINKAYKIETIGDAYMAASGVPEVCKDHAERLCNMSIGMQYESRCVSSADMPRPIKIRAGIHTGAVVSGVVGKRMPRYCLFGDAVNTASKMESNGVPMKIHVSETTYNASATGGFVFEKRGQMKIPGKDSMTTYILVKNNRKALWEIIDRPRSENNTIDGYSEFADISCYANESDEHSTNVTPRGQDGSCGDSTKAQRSPTTGSQGNTKIVVTVTAPGGGKKKKSFVSRLCTVM